MKTGQEIISELYIEKLNEIADLEQQLAEKDKEIEELKSNLKFASEQMQIMRQLMQDTVKDTRHQIYKEIKEKIQQHCNWNNTSKSWYIKEDKIEKLLDQILEQIEGEKK